MEVLGYHIHVGLVEADMDVIAQAIDTVLKAIGTEGEAAALAEAKALVATLAAKYPLPYAKL